MLTHITNQLSQLSIGAVYNRILKITHHSTISPLQADIVRDR